MRFFFKEHEHYSYPEAIKWLAKKYNIEIEETEQTDEQKAQMSERESMFWFLILPKIIFII